MGMEIPDDMDTDKYKQVFIKFSLLYESMGAIDSLPSTTL